MGAAWRGWDRKPKHMKVGRGPGQLSVTPAGPWPAPSAVWATAGPAMGSPGEQALLPVPTFTCLLRASGHGRGAGEGLGEGEPGGTPNPLVSRRHPAPLTYFLAWSFRGRGASSAPLETVLHLTGHKNPRTKTYKKSMDKG